MRKLNLILIAVIAAMAVGCAKDKDGGNGRTVLPPTDFTPYIPPAGPGLSPGTNWEHGATTELLYSREGLNFYAGWSTNVISNARINLNLQRFEPAAGASKPSFGGTVSIGFDNDGVSYTDTFSSLVNENHWYGAGTVTSNRENNKYNVWFTYQGNDVWHGFFQDSYGAIIVVIDQSDDEGDGQGPSSVSGSIYVMNFPNQYNSLVFDVSPTSCWFVTLGPYDCRTWKQNGQVNTEMDLYPYLENATQGTALEPKPEGYRKVGDFEGLNFQDAFNGEGQI